VPPFPRIRDRFPPRSAVLAVLGSIVLAALGAACASSKSAAAAGGHGRAIRVKFVDFRSGQNLELVDQSHTDRSELYSKKVRLEDAGTKVTTDEILEETLSYFRDRGFFGRTQPGASPATNEGVWSASLEIETPDGTVHANLGKSSTPAERQAFLECAKAFADVYNSTYQLQAVDRAPDWEAQKAKPKQPGLQVPEKKSP